MRLQAIRVNKAVTSGLYAEAQSVMLESQILVPRDTGNLASTGTVPLPTKTKGKVTVQMRYGGPRAVYAVRQHEEMGYRHTTPQSAKYLEIPFLERLRTLGLRMSVRVKAAIRGGSAPRALGGRSMTRGLPASRLPG